MSYDSYFHNFCSCDKTAPIAVLEKSIVKMKGLAVGEKSGVALHGAAANICFNVLKLLIISGVNTRDVNVLIFLDFSFRYDSVHQKY